MRWLRETWAGIRETVFVTAQVVTLGVLALTLGLIALNVVTHRPVARPTPATSPSRPLAALVPTLVPYTATPEAVAAAPIATPTGAAQALASPPAPLWTPPPREQPAPPTAIAPPPTIAPPPAPAAAPAAPTPTQPTRGAPSPTAPSASTAQMMKVLPSPDGLPARLRAEPTTKAPIVMRVPLGSRVEVIEAVTGDELQPGNPRWLRIKWRDATGYVYSALVGEP